MSETRYPVYVPSRGRADRPLTIRALQRYDVPVRIVVVPSQVDDYRSLVSERDELLVLPSDDMGEGMCGTRNWIRDHAEAEGAERHWQLDDNISRFYRLWEGERIPVDAGVSLAAAEDLTDRFGNAGVSGLNYTMFVPRDTSVPFYRNVHVYSCVLISHAMPCRHRLIWNDDTDLCLQALSDGWATLAVNAVNAYKLPTMVASGGMTGFYGGVGGTDTYGRYRMARVLEATWPSLVVTARKFGRYQHQVNWGAFRDVPLERSRSLDGLLAVDERGLTLQRVREVRSLYVEAVLRRYPEVLHELRASDPPDPLWRGMLAFRPVLSPPKLTLTCRTEADREELVGRLGCSVSKRTNGTLSVWWPPRERNDFASLRFVIDGDAKRDDYARVERSGQLAFAAV